MELDSLKKAWENQPNTETKLSALEIYKMAQSKSTSIVKWILIVGILEFSFWISLNFLIPSSYLEIYRKLNLLQFIYIVNYLHYAVVVLFLILFYRNFKAVDVVDNTKTLIKKILRVRRTVKFYVMYNIISFAVLTIIFNYIIFINPENMISVYELEGKDINIDEMFNVLLISQIVVFVILILLLLLFYFLLYGILLKKLTRNYKALIKLDK